MQHIPVLLQETLDVLDLKPGQTVVDATLGLAGHAQHFCQAIGSTGTFIGLDADEENLQLATETLKDVECNTQFHHMNFATIDSLDVPHIDVLFADLGVSSLHFDIAERGFSFRLDGPLDLRLDRSKGKPFSALLPGLTKAEIYEILTKYGELDRPHKCSQIVFEHRESTTTTFELKALIDEVYTFKAKQFYAKVFQAFRIYTNNELGALERLLDFAITHNIARIAIISFHSLEDRLVKHAFKKAVTSGKDEYTGKNLDDAKYTAVTKKPITPSETELELNPRSRSAKLRAIALKSHARD